MATNGALLLYQAMKTIYKHNSLDATLAAASRGSGHTIKDIERPLIRRETFFSGFITVIGLKPFINDLEEPFPRQKDISVSALAPGYDGNGYLVPSKFVSATRARRFRNTEITKAWHACVFHQNGDIKVTGLNLLASYLFNVNCGWSYIANKLLLNQSVDPTKQTLCWPMWLQNHGEEWLADWLGILIYIVRNRVSTNGSIWYAIERNGEEFTRKEWREYKGRHRYVCSCARIIDFFYLFAREQ